MSDKKKGCSNKKDVRSRIVGDSLCEDGTQLSSSFLHVVIVGQPSGHGERLRVQALGLTAWLGILTPSSPNGVAQGKFLLGNNSVWPLVFRHIF